MTNSIPITFAPLQAYDIGGSQALEGNEILTAPAHLLALQIEQLRGPDSKEALQTFAALPLEKRAQIFENGSHFELWKKEFVKLAQSSPTEAVEVLLQMREISFQSMPSVYERSQGMMGAVYLDSLPSTLRDTLVTELVQKDPRYYQAILSLDAQTVSQFERTQKFVGLMRIDADAAIDFLRQQKDGSDLYLQAQKQLTLDENRQLLMNPAFTKRHQENHASRYRPQFAYEDLPSPIDGQYSFGIDVPPEESVYFDQKQYAISQAESTRYLQTAGLGGCGVLILWDEKNKIAAMAHFDGMQDIEDSIDLILGDMVHNGADRSQISAQLLGAADTGAGKWSARTVTLIQSHIAEHNIPMVRQDVLDEVSKEKSGVTFDLATGTAFYYEETNANSRPSYYNSSDGRLIARHPTSWGAAPFKD